MIYFFPFDLIFLECVSNEQRLGLLPLHLATKSAEAIDGLCRAGADPNAVDKLGNTALHNIEDSDEQQAVVRMLIEDYGADVNARNICGATPLHQACARLQMQLIESLLAHGAQVDARDEHGTTPLQYAVLFQKLDDDKYGRVARALEDRLLLDRPYDHTQRVKNHDIENSFVIGYSERKENKGSQLNYMRCRLLTVGGLSTTGDYWNKPTVTPDGPSHAEIVKKLLDYNSDVNAADKYSRTPLMIASALGHVSIVKLLIAQGASITASDFHRTSALHEAARYGHDDVVETLLQSQRKSSLHSNSNFVELIEHRDKYPGETALHIAAGRGHSRCVEVLLEYGADVNCVDDTGYRPLHNAIEKVHPKVTRHLLVAGALVDVQNAEGNTPLHLAIALEKCNDEFILELIRRQANVNRSNNLGRTALHMAVILSRDNKIKLLVQNGADIMAHDVYGNTVVHMAMWATNMSSNDNIIDTLMSCGAEINAANYQGMTPLHFACIALNNKLINILASRGANCAATDERSATPLHYFLCKRFKKDIFPCTYSDFEPIKLLTDRQSNIQIQTLISRSTQLHVACRNPEIAKRCKEEVFFALTGTHLVDALGNTPIHYASWRFPMCELAVCSAANHLRNLCDHSALFSCLHILHRIDTKPIPPCISDEVDRMGRNILHMYCGRYQLCGPYLLRDIITRCRQLGLTDKTDLLQRTGLHHICITKRFYKIPDDYEDTVKGFIDHINDIDIFGRTALFYSCLYQDGNFCKLLVKLGANSDIADHDSVRPRDVFSARKRLASSGKHGSVVSMAQKDEPEEQEQQDDLRQNCAYLKFKQLTAWMDDETYNNLVMHSVTTFINDVAKKICQLDPRFQANPVLVGSAYEGTRLEYPNEFDFLIILTKFESIVSAERHQTFPGYVKFKKLDDVDHKAYDEFFNSDSILQPEIVKERLYALIIQATSYPDVWLNGVFEYLKIRIENKLKSPAIAVKLATNRLFSGTKLYIHHSYHMHHRLSIDFVPAIRFDEPLLPDASLATYAASRHRDVPAHAYAIMKSPKYSFGRETNGLCSASFVILESEIIRSAPASVKAAFMWLKHVNPRADEQPMSKNPVTGSQHKSLHKYMLKCSLLRCIVEGDFNQVKEVDIVNASTLTACIRIILKRVWHVVTHDAVPSIGNPETHLPVWEFEPFASFSAVYFRRLGMQYTPTELGNLHYRDYITDPSGLIRPKDMLSREDRLVLRSTQTYVNKVCLSFRRVFDLCQSFAKTRGRNSDVGNTTEDVELEQLATDYVVVEPDVYRTLERYISLYDDPVKNLFIDEGNRLDRLEPIYVASNDAASDNIGWDGCIQT